MVSRIGEALPAGETLAELRGSGRAAGGGTFAPAETVARVAFACAEPIDPGVAPFGALFLDPSQRSYEAGPLDCVGLRGGTLVGAEGLVMFQGRVVRDCLRGVEAWRLGALVAEVEPDGTVHLRRPCPSPVHHAGHVFVGYAGNWRNHAHWLAETLPRLEVFRWMAGQLPGLRLALPRFPAGSAPARALALLGVAERDVVRVDDDAAVRADTLWAMSGIDVWRPPRVVATTAGRLSASVALGVAEAPGGLSRRVYLRRGTATRVMTGHDALRPVLDQFGFRTVTAQDVPLDEQIRVFRSARCVVGETSAGLANIVFCPPGAKVLELFNPAFVQPAHWSLASLCGLEYGFLVGRHVPTPGLERPEQNSAYLIAPEQLADGLRRMGLEPAQRHPSQCE